MSRSSRNKSHTADPLPELAAHPSAREAGQSPPEGDASHGIAESRENADQGSGRFKAWLPPVLIIVAGLLVYANSLNGEFVLDDVRAIEENVTIRRLWPVAAVLFPSHDLIPEASTVEGRPLLNLSFALNYAVGGLEVWGYHTVNLGIHLVAALLLYGVVRRTMLLPLFRERAGSGPHQASVRSPREVPARSTSSTNWTVTAQSLCGPPSTLLALVVALLWVVHPLQTESVSYLSQRAESLVGMFFLLTMYFSVRGLSEERSLGWRVGAVAACLLGMAAKEVMVTAPLLVLLYDWMFVGGSWREVWRQRWRFYVCLMVLGWGTLAAILLGTAGSNLGNVQALLGQLGGEGVSTETGHEVHWLDYARIQIWALARYVRLCFWPSPLVFYYGKNVAEGFLGVLPFAIFVVTLMAATVWALRRRSWTGYAGAWFFLILAPTSSVVPLSGQLIAEHRMYLPLAAVIVLAVVGVFSLWGLLAGCADQRHVPRGKMARALVAGLLVVAFGTLTMARNRDYQTALSIWQDTVMKWPESPDAQNGLGLALYKQDRVDEAVARFQRALEVDELFAPSHYNLAIALIKLGKWDEAIRHFERAVALRPRSSEARNNLGEAFLQTGKLNEAVEQFKRAIESDPLNVAADNNLGNALFQQGRLSEAIPHYERALQIDPESAAAHSNLGNVLLRSGKVDEAIAHYERALEILPDFVDAHNNLAAAYQQEGRLKEALAHLEEAVKESPRALGVRNNLALFLATIDDASLRDGARAVELAQGVNQDSGGNRPGFLHTLAAAYAEAGKFIEADETAERAQSLAVAQEDRIQAEVLRRARRLYQAGKPLRHSPAAGAP